MFACTIVGSYPQPEWLIDREKLAKQFPPRTRALELWRIGEPHLRAAQDDATRLAILDQERAGLDIVSDGEIRRESYSNHFATALEGVDLDNPGKALDRSGEPVFVPRIVGPIRRKRPVVDYLQAQNRYRHLFADDPRARKELEHLQAIADHNIEVYGLAGEGRRDSDTADTVRRGGRRWA